MTDYKTMYHILGKGITNAVDIIEKSMLQTDVTIEVRHILIEAQREAEEIYIDTCGENKAVQ